MRRSFFVPLGLHLMAMLPVGAAVMGQEAGMAPLERFAHPAGTIAGDERWQLREDNRQLEVLDAAGAVVGRRSFEMRYSMYRDGALVHESPEVVDPESLCTVAADGRFAIVGHPAGNRRQWSARVLDPMGLELFDADLAVGHQAVGLVLVSDSLWVLSEETSKLGPGARRQGHLMRVDVHGKTRLADFEAPQELVAFPGSLPGALVRTADELIWFDARTGVLGWRVQRTLRPVGTHAWTSWNSPVGTLLAVVHSDVRRRGAGPPPVFLELFEAQTGRGHGVHPIERRGPLALLRLLTLEGDLVDTGGPSAERLCVDWMGQRDLYGWKR